MLRKLPATPSRSLLTWPWRAWMTIISPTPSCSLLILPTSKAPQSSSSVGV